MLRIPKKILEEMIAHARQEFPKECCGLLAGNNGIVSKIYTMTNTDQSQVSYLMDPKEQLAAIKDMRKRGVETIASYHSHPKTDAEPSIKDIELAYDPDVYYVILSLAEPMRTDIRAFKIVDRKVSKAEIKII